MEPGWLCPAGLGMQRCRELQSPSQPSQPCLAGCPWGHFGARTGGEGSASGNCLPLPGRWEEEEEDSPGALSLPLPLLSSSCSSTEHRAGSWSCSTHSSSSPSQTPCRTRMRLPRARRPRLCPVLQIPSSASSRSQLAALPARRKSGLIPLEQLPWGQCHSRGRAVLWPGRFSAWQAEAAPLRAFEGCTRR